MPDRLRMETNQVRIDLTPAQKSQIFRLTGLEYPLVEMPAARLAALAMVAVAAGSEALPVTPSAVKQMSGHQQDSLQGNDLFTIDVALTPEQKEQLRRATGHDVSSLRMVPDDIHILYKEAWKENARPIRVGRSIVVTTRANRVLELSTDRVIELPVGECSPHHVFGTGRHPATQLSLILLEAYVKPGDRVLDLGTGSGILAVAAAKLGANEVLALDIDPTVVAAARVTVATNDLTEIVEVRQGSIEAAAPPYDLVVAHIFPSLTIRLAPDLATTVQHAGVFLSGGHVAARAQHVADAVCAAGFRLEEQRSQSDWQGMVFRKA